MTCKKCGKELKFSDATFLTPMYRGIAIDPIRLCKNCDKKVKAFIENREDV
jgi:hypothetical protein